MDTIFEEPDENDFQSNRSGGRELPSTDSFRSRNLPTIGMNTIEITPNFAKTTGLSSLRHKAKSVTINRSFHKSQNINNPQLAKLRKDFFKTKMVQINDDNLTPSDENTNGNEIASNSSDDDKGDENSENKNDTINNIDDSTKSANEINSNINGIVDAINRLNDRRQIPSLSNKNVILRGNEISGNFSDSYLPKYGNLYTIPASHLSTRDNTTISNDNDNDKNDKKEINSDSNDLLNNNENITLENNNEDDEDNKEDNSNQFPTIHLSSGGSGGRYGTLQKDNKGFRKMAFKNIFRSNITYFDSADYYNQPNDKPKPKSHLQNQNSNNNSKDSTSHVARRSSTIPEEYYDKSKHNSDNEDDTLDMNTDIYDIDVSIGNTGGNIGDTNNNEGIPL